MAEWRAGHADEDIAEFAKWEQAQTLRQKASPEERQRLWELSLEWVKDQIPNSQEYNQRIVGLAQRLRSVGTIPEDCDVEGACRLLWGIVFLDIMEKTGADRERRDGRPREIGDVLDFGHLSNRLRGEFDDQSWTQTGQRRVRSVHRECTDSPSARNKKAQPP
jgi:hypothetical protein